MFGTILITLITILQIHIFWRAASVPFIKRHVSRRALLITAAACWTVSFIGIFFGHHGTGPGAVISEFLGMNWMGTVLLLFISLLFVDVITLFGLVLRPWTARLRGWAIAAGFTLAIVALVQGMRPPVVTAYDVRLKDLPPTLDGTIVAAVSDLHVGSLLGERWLKGRLKQINALNPDVILLLGDIFEGHGSGEDALAALFKQLQAPMGVWAVTGNHAFHGPDNSVLNRMNTAGFRVLRDQWEEITPGLILSGVDDLTTHQRRGKTDDPVTRALTGRPQAATIFLSHTPTEYEKAARLGVGLMLSGHTHGGQIWPFNHLTKLRYSMLAGRYQVDSMPLIVCRGTGTWGPRMRLWKRGEILRIKLHSSVS